MYAALWRLLPGPLWLRVLLSFVIAAGVLSLLVLWIFPWAASIINPQEATVGG